MYHHLTITIIITITVTVIVVSENVCESTMHSDKFKTLLYTIIAAYLYLATYSATHNVRRCVTHTQQYKIRNV